MLLIAKIFKFLPLNLLSFFVGWLVRLELPGPLQNLLCKAFILMFSINMSDAERPVQSYKSLEDLFTRRLVEGARPIESAFVSPADGFLAVSAAANNNTAAQVKGINYDLSELVFGKLISETQFSWYTTVYLAPHNYHRVHAPVRATIKRLRYIPGTLWPVNQPFLKVVPQLFTQNERLVFEMQLENGGMVYLVMVGALNVGRMATPLLPDFFTNVDGTKRSLVQEFDLAGPLAIAPGDELGTFMLGSTVVMVFDEKAKEAYQLKKANQNAPIRMGRNLMQDKGKV